MLREFAAGARTAVQFPHGVIFVSLASMLSTASPQAATARDESWPATALAIDSTEMATATYRLPSALPYSETTAAQTVPPACTYHITRLSGIPVDYREQLRERIRSVMINADNCLNGTSPSRQAIDDALQFVDLLPADARVLHVSAADDGEINFFRRGHGVFVDIGFFGDGEIHYYACVDALGIDVDGSQPFTGRSLPRDLVIPITTD